MEFNPDLDLTLTRTTELSADAIWKAWTDPSLLVQWFCPAPWKTVDCVIDARPGGEFGCVMESPEGERFPDQGCFLEVDPGRRLVWTNALGPGYRPKAANPEALIFVATVEFTPTANGATYTATVRHATTEDRDRHVAFQFESGWSAAFDQLVALMSNRAPVL